MRSVSALCVILFLSVTATAQTTTPPATATTVYDQSVGITDSVGNLVVFDSGFTFTPSTTGTGFFNRGQRTPKTRITIVRPTGAPETHEYDASFFILGSGRAIYAIASSSDRRLIAINPNVSAAAALTGFPNLVLTTRGDVRYGTNDILSIVDLPTRPASTTSTATTTTVRQSKVVRFNGTAFDQVSSANLP